MSQMIKYASFSIDISQLLLGLAAVVLRLLSYPNTVCYGALLRASIFGSLCAIFRPQFKPHAPSLILYSLVFLFRPPTLFSLPTLLVPAAFRVIGFLVDSPNLVTNARVWSILNTLGLEDERFDFYVAFTEFALAINSVINFIAGLALIGLTGEVQILQILSGGGYLLFYGLRIRNFSATKLMLRTVARKFKSFIYVALLIAIILKA